MKYFFLVSIIVLIFTSFIIYYNYEIDDKTEESINGKIIEQKYKGKNNSKVSKKETTQTITIEDSKKDSFVEDFSRNFALEETGRIEKSESIDWWVNSGAFLYSENGISRTLFGALEKGSKWQVKFSQGKNDIPSETNGGYYPQNIFRLVTRLKWKNFSQEAYYRIKKYNLSKDKHRRGSNGLLLFNRYQDGDNLYYTGVRVDGTAVIKKKIKGEYFTMIQKAIFDGKYNRKTNPNLLPINKWIGLKSEVRTVNQNEVEIKVFIDEERDSSWKLILETKDDGKSFGGKSILDEGYGGIRTDFMDVEFDDYKIKKVE